MNKINCSVNNCSHNNSGICHSNRVNIVGFGAAESKDTCCGSFLDERLYSTLTNNTNSVGPCDSLLCKVEECSYNKNKLCTLDSIDVGSGASNIYTETCCESFSNK